MGNQAIQITQKDRMFLSRLVLVDKTVSSLFGKVSLHNIISEIEEAHYIMQLQLPISQSDSSTIARAEFYRNIEPQEAVVSVEVVRLSSEKCSSVLLLDLYLKYYNFTLADYVQQKKQTHKQLSKVDMMYIFKTLAALGQHLEAKHGKIYFDVFHINEFFLTTEGHLKMYPFKLEQYDGVYCPNDSFQNILARNRTNEEELFAPFSCRLNHLITNPSCKPKPSKQASLIMPDGEFSLNSGANSEARISKAHVKSSTDDIFDLAVLMLEVISQTDLTAEQEVNQYNHLRSTWNPGASKPISFLNTTQRKCCKSDKPMLILTKCICMKNISKKAGLLLESMLKGASDYDKILKQLKEIRVQEGIKVTKSIRLIEEKQNLSYSTSVQDENIYKS